MATKVINTILNLKDNMSGGLMKTARNMGKVNKETLTATRSVLRFKNQAVSAISKTVKTFGKLAAAAGGATAALAAKTGLSEAMDLEGYRLQLETATKDTQKASEIMQYAINLANKTPFEGGELVEGAAKFEAMGMAAKKWLPLAGDMAAATNKSFDQATEALIDAQTGELERLKEFGITKAKIVEQGEKLFSGVQLVNNKGQIVNQEKFNEAMISLMQDRFAGGMEKQATTMKGLWSTVTGVTKSALATITGVTADGSIRAGSALDRLKQGVSSLAERFSKWQQDGTIDSLAQTFDQGLGKAVDTASAAFRWLTENGDTILVVLKNIAAAFALVKIFQFASGVAKAVKTFQTFLRVVGVFAATNPVVLGIGAAVAAGAFLIANWDQVKATALSLWDGAKQVFAGIRDSVVGAFNAAKDSVSGFFSWIGEKLGELDDKIESVPVLGSIYQGVKGAGSWVLDKLQGNAMGTPYFSGGLTRINERGGEIVDLPSGTRIIPHDVSRRMAGGPNVAVYVTVQGNVIGNAEYADSLGRIIVQKILRALDNV